MRAALLSGAHHFTLGGSGQPGPTQPGAPAIPDGVYPMGYQGYVKGALQPLVDLNRDWNFSTDGFDLSGFRIHGKVVWPAASGTGATVGGDGFEIVGAPGAGTSGILLDCNTHFTQTFPTFQHFSINPTVPVVSANGIMGNEFTIFDADIQGVGGDPISPNNLSNGKRPLNINADWFYCHDYVYYLTDGGSHVDGTHNDDAQIVGGTSAFFTRGYMTGCAHPTKGDGAHLRTIGRSAGPYANVPCPDGQGNSCIQITQDVDHVSCSFDRCRFGGGLYATVNLASNGNAAQLGPIYITNSLFDGNSIGGNDIGGDNDSTPGTNLVQSGNKHIDGTAIKVTRVVA